MTGQVEEKRYKLHPEYEESKKWIAQIFKNAKDQIDEEAVAYVIEELKQMLNYFKDVNEHQIRGMSIFIVIDTEKKSYTVKLIDLSSFEEICQDGQQIKRDDGVSKGLESLIRILDVTNVYSIY